MQAKHGAWVVMIAALGMMAGLLGSEVAEFSDWQQATAPEFVGKSLIHFGSVVAAFVAGRLVPTKVAP